MPVMVSTAAGKGVRTCCTTMLFLFLSSRFSWSYSSSVTIDLPVWYAIVASMNLCSVVLQGAAKGQRGCNYALSQRVLLIEYFATPTTRCSHWVSW